MTDAEPTPTMRVILDRIPPGEHVNAPTWRRAAIRALRSDWDDEGLCKGKDPERWFPERGDLIRTANSKRICQTCPCAEPCLAFGLFEHVGIFGGVTARRRIDYREALRAHHKQRNDDEAAA